MENGQPTFAKALLESLRNAPLPMIDYDPDDQDTQNLVDALRELKEEEKSLPQK